MGLAEGMAAIDAVILEALDGAGLADHATIRGVDHLGAFEDKFDEVPTSDGVVEVRAITFRCRFTAQIGALDPDEQIDVVGKGKYRVLRPEPPGGDESGDVRLLLGTVT